jgi:hypothetical protein
MDFTMARSKTERYRYSLPFRSVVLDFILQRLHILESIHPSLIFKHVKTVVKNFTVVCHCTIKSNSICPHPRQQRIGGVVDVTMYGYGPCTRHAQTVVIEETPTVRESELNEGSRPLDHPQCTLPFIPLITVPVVTINLI